MITKEQFKKVIRECMSFNEYYDKVYELKLDFLDSPFHESFWTIVDMLWKTHFTKEAVETIDWWLFEYDHSDKPAMWDENDNVIPMQTIDNLWNYVKEERI